MARGRFEAVARTHESVRWAALGASPLPPTPEETSRLLTTEGLERVKARFRAACAEDAPAGCVDAARFNAFGYALLGKHQVHEAIAVLELVAWAHPGLANAQDSLADAYLAAGDRERARRSLQRAIELAPTDATLDPPTVNGPSPSGSRESGHGHDRSTPAPARGVEMLLEEYVNPLGVGQVEPLGRRASR